MFWIVQKKKKNQIHILVELVKSKYYIKCYETPHDRHREYHEHMSL